MKKTVLHPKHLGLNAKMAEFAGFDMPIQYSGIVAEHMAVRHHAGIFDVSHMGNFFLSGRDVPSFLQTMVTADIRKLEPNKAVYTLMCYPDGGAVDDLLVYCLGINRYMMIVNAANIEKDLRWLKENEKGEVQIDNLSAEYAILAVQGPDAARILDTLCETPLSNAPAFSIGKNRLQGKEFLASRTGYTGEDGFEITLRDEFAVELWDALLHAGVTPCGLGARDTLRLEMGYTLYGHEINGKTNVLEAGLGWIVDLNCPDPFIGKEALIASKQQGLKKKIIGLVCEDKGIPRADCKVFKQGVEVGVVTSGGHSPILNKGIALARVDSAAVAAGDYLDIDVRGRLLSALSGKRKFIHGR